jgi:hypothetical protein
MSENKFHSEAFNEQCSMINNRMYIFQIILPFLKFGKVGGLKCTDEANQIHGGVQMPILQLSQKVSEKGSLTLFLEHQISAKLASDMC